MMAFFMVIAVYFAQRSKIRLTWLFFAISFSVKGGGLLWLPGFLLVTDFAEGLVSVVLHFLFFVAFNVVLAIPFLIAHAEHFYEQAFDFGRRFN
jgi:uncharacterized membrane protein